MGDGIGRDGCGREEEMGRIGETLRQENLIKDMECALKYSEKTDVSGFVRITGTDSIYAILQDKQYL